MRSASPTLDPAATHLAFGTCEERGRLAAVTHVALDIAAYRDRPALRVRPWCAQDMPGLLVSMAPEYPAGGLKAHPGIHLPRPSLNWRGPLNSEEAAIWLSGTERGWACGDWLTFAVLDASQNNVVGHVGLENRDGGRVGTGER